VTYELPRRMIKKWMGCVQLKYQVNVNISNLNVFRLFLWFKWVRRITKYSLFWDFTKRKWAVTDVSGQPIGPFLKGQAVQEESIIQCACAILPSVACPDLQYFPTLSHKRNDFREKVTEHKMCVLIFSTTSVWNSSHSKEKSGR